MLVSIITATLDCVRVWKIVQVAKESMFKIMAAVSRQLYDMQWDTNNL
jgi:hypothetical protein